MRSEKDPPFVDEQVKSHSGGSSRARSVPSLRMVQVHNIADDSESDEEEKSDEDDDSEADSEDEDAPKKTKKRKPSRLTHEMAMREKDIIINKRIKDMGEDGEIDAMRYVMLPRKKRELYKAMQLGLAKKEARTNELKERAAKLKKEGVMDDKGRLVENKEEKKAAAKKKAKK